MIKKIFVPLTKIALKINLKICVWAFNEYGLLSGFIAKTLMNKIENCSLIFYIGISVRNIKLADLTLKQLNNHHVCNLYSKPMDFNNIWTQQRLKQKAVPMKYDFTELPVDMEHV